MVYVIPFGNIANLGLMRFCVLSFMVIWIVKNLVSLLISFITMNDQGPDVDLHAGQQ